MDRRTHPANNYAACRSLVGRVAHHNFVDPVKRAITVAVVDLCDTPNGNRDRQLLFGDFVNVIDTRENWAFVQSLYDGYVGYVPAHTLGMTVDVSHVVVVPQTHIYQSPNFKSRNVGWLPMGAQVHCYETSGRFLRCDAGWLPMQHLVTQDQRPQDPISVAIGLVGVPYLWGGNSAQGIDCSGLVQLSLKLCGLNAPADSDQQQSLGHDTSDAPERADLLFWRGHVAWVLDERRILHANAHTMSVTIENRTAAINRIAAQGNGPIIAHRRLFAGA